MVNEVSTSDSSPSKVNLSFAALVGRRRGVASLLLLTLGLWGPACRVQEKVSGDADPIGTAFRNRASGVSVESAGTVERLLPDDLEGSRHQRFIVRLARDRTLLVAHNIDLAPRVPVVEGERVRFRGQYEWNPKGGVLHWTHHDPAGRRPGGWIRHEGRVYR